MKVIEKKDVEKSLEKKCVKVVYQLGKSCMWLTIDG